MKPKEITPNLEVTLSNHETWSLKEQKIDTYLMIVFYRGYHCPVCKKQLETVTEKLPDFEERGVDVIAISMDHINRLEKTTKEWDVDGLK